MYILLKNFMSHLINHPTLKMEEKNILKTFSITNINQICQEKKKINKKFDDQGCIS